MNRASTQFVLLPRPYPDETLHGLVTRYVTYLGKANLRAITSLLFGTSTVPAVDLPTRLAHFARSVDVGVGPSPDECVSELTLFPFLSFGMPEARKDGIRSALLDKPRKGASMPLVLGMAGSSVFKPRFLRHCSRCATEQRATWGEAFWRRVHQIPGVLVCPDHACHLVDTAVPYRRSGCRAYHDAEVFIPEGTSPAADEASTRVARFCNDVLLGRVEPRPDLVAACRPGLAFPGGPATFSQRFCDAFPSSLLTPMGCALDALDPSNWLLNLVRRPHRPHHAIRHVLVQMFLESHPPAEFVRLPSLGKRKHRPAVPTSANVLELRATWERALERAPSRSRLAAARSDRPTYERLVLLDREWLFREPQRYNRRPDNQRRLDTKARDRTLVPRVEAAIEALRTAIPVRRVTRSAIIVEAGLPRGALSQLPALPRCAALVHAALEPVDDFHVRLVAQTAIELREASVTVTKASIRRATRLTGPIGTKVRQAILVCAEPVSMPDQ